jgi:hypothetical protein
VQALTRIGKESKHLRSRPALDARHRAQCRQMAKGGRQRSRLPLIYSGDNSFGVARWTSRQRCPAGRPLVVLTPWPSVPLTDNREPRRARRPLSDVAKWLRTVAKGRD